MQLTQKLLFIGLSSGVAHAQAQIGPWPWEDHLAPLKATFSSCPLACSSLHAFLPGQVFYPGSATYEEESVYWSQQQTSVTPTCRLSPPTAQDVSTILSTLRRFECPFALKSGGHVPFVGASNIDGGVTIDLVKLTDLQVSEDRTTTSVGPGNRWVDVYNTLDTMGLSVVGGRVADIGVGGLITGGGISFFSGRYGWACDNVVNYQVVLADGAIKDVNQSSYPDLYFSLRGGGNNFGIVTRFDLFTFTQGDLWGGSNAYTIDQSSAMISAFENFNAPTPSDPYAAVILAYAYVQAEDEYVIVGDFEYGRPIVNPPALREFMALPNISSTMRITNISDLTMELKTSNPIGFRQTFWTAMFKNSGNMMFKTVDIFQDEIDAIKNVTDIVPSCVFQPVTVDIISHFSKNGGNALGITLEDGPLILLEIDIQWSDPTDDARVFNAARNIINRADAAAVTSGLDHPFIYMNYAAAEQDVFSSYGSVNKNKLARTQRKYDPEGVFTRLQPGYFKI